MFLEKRSITLKSQNIIITFWIFVTLILSSISYSNTIEISGETLRDKIRGGLLGQIIGNLNGLQHENQYILEPGNVTEFTPSLPNGAWTDDDTDFEWVYIIEMQKRNRIMLTQKEIAQLWKERINRRIWCSNQYARYLMDLGIDPPLTGKFVLNPWADFNISGQFLCETFGLLAPAMPQTAAEIALNYTKVAIDLEPAQSTQMFTSMIATAFITEDINKIIGAGFRSLDKKSFHRGMIQDIRKWHRQYPNDWKTTRRLAKEKYMQVNGAMRDRNGYELNSSSVIAALLYGEGDFVKTQIHAFNFGWDADNIAATAGTIVGVMKGYRWMMSQGWQIVDRYENRTRDNMPMNETITSFADRLIDLSEKVIIEHGGSREFKDAQPIYNIQSEKPNPVYPFTSVEKQTEQLKSKYKDTILTGITQGNEPLHRARSAYMAICLDMAPTIKEQHPQKWNTATQDLQNQWKIMQVLYYNSPVPAADKLREKANTAGLVKPEKRRKVWE
jgi:ADP-ribosylglycohydrolase